MASNITVDTLTKGSTTLNTDEIVDTSSNQICKAWVNFNGTGTVAIRDSYNVSSITDNGTGSYTINFSNSMANTNYCHTSGLSNGSHSAGWALGEASRATTSINCVGLARTGGNTLYDGMDAFMTIFGD